MLTFFFILVVAALCLALIKQWQALAFVAFIIMQLLELSPGLSFLDGHSFNVHFIAQIVLILLFNLIPLCYALAKRTSGLFEPLLIAVSGFIGFINLKWLIANYYNSAEQSSFIAYFFGETASGTIVNSLCFAFGTWILIELALIFKRATRPLLVMVIALVASFYSNVLVHAFAIGEDFMLILNMCALLFFAIAYLTKRQIYAWVSYACAIIFLLVQILAYIKYTKFRNLPDDYTPLFNAPNGALLVLVLFFLVFNYLIYRYKKQLVDNNELSNLLLTGAALTPLYWLNTWVWRSPYDSVGAVLYSSCLLIAGFAYDRIWIVYVSCLGIAVGLYYGLVIYPLLMRQHYILDITLLLGGLSLIFISLYFALLFVRKNDESILYSHVKQAIGGLALLLPFTLIRAYLIFGVHYYYMLQQARSAASSFFTYLLRGKSELGKVENVHELQNYKNYALAVYYSVTGLLLIISGFAYKKVYVRYAGLILLFLAVLKLYSIITALSDTLTRILAFLVVGTLLIVGSYIYQRISKK